MYDDEDIGGVCWFDLLYTFFFFFQAEDGIRDKLVTEVQTCALPISRDQGERRGLRLPPLGVEEVRDRLLEAELRDHPPGRPGELRVPGRAHDRRRLPHAQRRRPRHARDRRRRGRLWRGDGGGPRGGAPPGTYPGPPYPPTLPG